MYHRRYPSFQITKYATDWNLEPPPRFPATAPPPPTPKSGIAGAILCYSRRSDINAVRDGA